jgi:capsular polysaccharide biosynthesis protein
MADRRDSNAVRFSCQVYHRLLLVYPKSHREDYGSAMLQLFRDQCREAWANRRVTGLLGFWLRAAADILKTSLLEHLSTLNRSRIMSTSFRPTIKPLPAFFGICAVVFFVIFLANVLITFMIPEMYAGAATILISRPTATPDPTWAQTEVQVIFSSVVLERAAKNLNLPDVWGKKYNNGMPLNVNDTVAMVKSRLEIYYLPLATTADSVALRISSYSDNPNEAANIVNGVVDAYRTFRVEQSSQANMASMERKVTVLDTAVPQFRPVRPNKQLNMVIGALAGILVGVIVAPLVLGLFAWIKNRRSVSSLPQKA